MTRICDARPWSILGGTPGPRTRNEGLPRGADTRGLSSGTMASTEDDLDARDLHAAVVRAAQTLEAQTLRIRNPRLRGLAVVVVLPLPEPEIHVVFAAQELPPCPALTARAARSRTFCTRRTKDILRRAANDARPPQDREFDL